MKTNRAGIDLIKEFEGFRPKAYKCPAGIWTCGYGTTKGVKPDTVWTKAEAEDKMEDDLIKFEDGVRILAGNKTTENQFSAMVCFAYNVGLGALARSFVMTYHRKEMYAEAADAFLLWNKAAGKVLPGLVRRREAERRLYLAK